MSFRPLLETTLHNFQHAFAVNVGEALTSVKAVLPAMIVDHRGTILFTGGGLALYPAAGLGTLGVGKAAMRNVALTLAKEVRDARIHVATVTICGVIQAGTFFAPEKIAEVYWQLHAERWDQARDGVIYREENAP
jgi:NADP-dependent 3-hydroxy acid dehydrogenase YdfG